MNREQIESSQLEARTDRLDQIEELEPILAPGNTWSV